MRRGGPNEEGYMYFLIITLWSYHLGHHFTEHSIIEHLTSNFHFLYPPPPNGTVETSIEVL